MKRIHSRPPQGQGAAVLDLAVLQNPLDYIAEDHMREREICAMLDQLAAETSYDPDTGDQIRCFLKYQLPAHLEDEEIDLFPMMLKRCEPEDEIEPVIRELRGDHGHAATDGAVILGLLDEPGKGFSARACAQMVAFAKHARRHLIVENAIILPIARARLTPDDLRIMLQHMLERRGLDRAMETL